MYSSVPASGGNVGFAIKDPSHNFDNVLLVVVTCGQGLISNVVIKEKPAGHAGR